MFSFCAIRKVLDKSKVFVKSKECPTVGAWIFASDLRTFFFYTNKNHTKNHKGASQKLP